MISRIKGFSLRIGLLLVVYSVIRFLFYIFNYSSLSSFPISDVAMAFASGIRFDLSAALLINVPLLLFLLVPEKILHKKIYEPFSHYLFLILNLPFLIFNLVDLEYFKFTGGRITAHLIYIRNEAAAQLDQFILSYWFVPVFLILIAAFLHKGSSKARFFTASPTLNPITYALVSLLLVGCTVIGVRGGLQIKVLQTAHAFAQGHTELGALTLNSSFSILKTKLKTRLERKEYFDSKESVVRHIPQPVFNPEISNHGDNVVLIILESFATEFWGAANNGKGFTPFLDSLAEKSIFLKNNYANGRKSIEALPSIFFGIPSLMKTPFAKSSYQQNEWVGLGTVLREMGYSTHFFHGAALGTMYFDAIAARAGIENHYAKEQYPNEKDFDGNWGIFDEPFLQYMSNKISSFKEPFFASAFTISSHQPFTVPPQYRDKFPKGTLQIHQSIGYVDYSVKKFFEHAEKQPWYKNTLFIITADHTLMSDSPHYSTATGAYMVPLLFFHPEKELPKIDPNKVSQHTDIVPTVLDYLGAKPKRSLLFGRSLFDQSQEGEAFFHLNGNFWLIGKDHFMQFNPSANFQNLFLRSDLAQASPVLNQPEVRKKYLSRLKAYIQYFNAGMIDNDIYDWSTLYSQAQ